MLIDIGVGAYRAERTVARPLFVPNGQVSLLTLPLFCLQIGFPSISYWTDSYNRACILKPVQNSIFSQKTVIRFRGLRLGALPPDPIGGTAPDTPEPHSYPATLNDYPSPMGADRRSKLLSQQWADARVRVAHNRHFPFSITQQHRHTLPTAYIPTARCKYCLLSEATACEKKRLGFLNKKLSGWPAA